MRVNNRVAFINGNEHQWDDNVALSVGNVKK